MFPTESLGVAISRGQCLAYLVCSPHLLDARCKSIEDMELVNALCRACRVCRAQTCLASASHCGGKFGGTTFHRIFQLQIL